MAQSGYENTFINLMLGWMRNLASSIADMFRVSTGAQSGGAALLTWLSAHWLTLLIVLILLGIAVDWIVWMLRWRPYWLWFRRRRILLDDDIDEVLSEGELARRYADEGDEYDDRPRFRSHALRRGEADDEIEDEIDDDAYDDPYEDDDWGAPSGGEAEGHAFADELDDEAYGDEAYDDEGYEDEGYEGEAYDDEAYGDEAASDEFYDDGWDDAPKRPGKRGFRLFGRKSEPVEDEDPFAVDEAELGDLDDDFYSVVSEEPQYGGEDLRIYARPEPDGQPDESGLAESRLAPLPDAESGEYDERIGYPASASPITGTERSRKSRRKQER